MALVEEGASLTATVRTPSLLCQPLSVEYTHCIRTHVCAAVCVSPRSQFTPVDLVVPASSSLPRRPSSVITRCSGRPVIDSLIILCLCSQVECENSEVGFVALQKREEERRRHPTLHTSLPLSPSPHAPRVWLAVATVRLSSLVWGQAGCGPHCALEVLGQPRVAAFAGRRPQGAAQQGSGPGLSQPNPNPNTIRHQQHQLLHLFSDSLTSC